MLHKHQKTKVQKLYYETMELCHEIAGARLREADYNMEEPKPASPEEEALLKIKEDFNNLLEKLKRQAKR